MNRPARAALFATLLPLSAVGVLAYGLGAPEATLLGPAVVRAPDPRTVALTFDDGPSPDTARILDVLKAEGVHATFFLCGDAARRHPELVRRIRDEGHTIGNHTWSHPWLYLMPRDAIAGEIDRTQDELQRLTGRRPTLFRPPYGVRWFSLWPVLRERGLTMVMWNDRAYDGRYDADGIARAALSGLRPGAIVLLHDGFEARPDAETGRAETVKALPAIIRGARAAGYALAPLRG